MSSVASPPYHTPEPTRNPYQLPRAPVRPVDARQVARRPPTRLGARTRERRRGRATGGEDPDRSRSGVYIRGSSAPIMTSSPPLNPGYEPGGGGERQADVSRLSTALFRVKPDHQDTRTAFHRNHGQRGSSCPAPGRGCSTPTADDSFPQGDVPGRPHDHRPVRSGANPGSPLPGVKGTGERAAGPFRIRKGFRVGSSPRIHHESTGFTRRPNPVYGLHHDHGEQPNKDFTSREVLRISIQLAAWLAFSVVVELSPSLAGWSPARRRKTCGHCRHHSTPACTSPRRCPTSLPHGRRRGSFHKIRRRCWAAPSRRRRATYPAIPNAVAGQHGAGGRVSPPSAVGVGGGLLHAGRARGRTRSARAAQPEVDLPLMGRRAHGGRSRIGRGRLPDGGGDGT